MNIKDRKQEAIDIIAQRLRPLVHNTSMGHCKCCLITAKSLYNHIAPLIRGEPPREGDNILEQDCQKCGGSGWVPHSLPEVRISTGILNQAISGEKTCPQCDGTGNDRRNVEDRRLKLLGRRGYDDYQKMSGGTKNNYGRRSGRGRRK